jgi:uncharacterized membrane protein
MTTVDDRDRRSPRGRLDQPVEPRRGVPRPSYDAEAFGRSSERIARFLGTGRFLVYQTAFISVWLLWNAVTPGSWQFDPYTFTFLTLILSLQAAYAAPLILLAQNRQDDRDRVNLEQDRQQTAHQLEDTAFVARELAAVRLALGDVVTRDFLRSELRALLEEADAENEARRDKGRKDKKRPRQPAAQEDGAQDTPAAADGPPPD